MDIGFFLLLVFKKQVIHFRERSLDVARQTETIQADYVRMKGLLLKMQAISRKRYPRLGVFESYNKLVKELLKEDQKKGLWPSSADATW